MTKTTKPKPRHLTTEHASIQALAKSTEEILGSGKHTAIAEKMTELTGQPHTRQMIGRWLDPDTSKRVQPSLGAGILLLWAIAILGGRAEGRRFTAKLSVHRPEPKKAAPKAKPQPKRK